MKKSAPFATPASLGMYALLVLLIGHARAVDSVVVFNEINYHPVDGAPGGEWVELHNQMAIDIDLSAWHIEDGINFTFPEGTIIPGGGHLVVAADPAGLQAATGLTGVLGGLTGQLANAGEKLELRDRNERLMDEVTYVDGGRWPIAADGSGATLAKRHANTTSGPPENWASSVVTGGTPGARNFPDAAAVVRPLVSLNGLWRFEATGTDLGSAWKDPGFDDSAWPGENGASLVGYWPLNGDAAATVGTPGTLSGAVSPAADRTGTASRALAFSGASQYVEVPGGGGLNAASAGTISLWAKWNASFQDADCCGGFGAILARQGDGQFSDNILALSTANPATAKLVWRQSGGPAPVLITSTTTIGTGWRHIAVTFSPAGSTLYVDGVVQGSATGSSLSDGAGVALSIGAWASGGGGFMNGTMDDVAIWNAPLAPEQIAELAASTKSPINYSGAQNAVYFSGDGRLASNDELRSTELTVGPVTHYFRSAFDFSDPPARTALKLDLAVDDGAVVWLNGVEVHRHNLPAGPAGYGTRATAAVGDAPLLTGLTLPSSALVVGKNVLAVEVHQAADPDAGMVFGAGLTATISPPGLDAATPDSLVINELSAAGAGPLHVELINRGAGAVDTAGFVVKRAGISPDASFSLPAQALAPGAYLVLDEATLGFGAVAGDRLFLIRPGGAAVADAIDRRNHVRARWPNGTGPFLTPAAPTIGAANAVVLRDDIVINEIMYRAPSNPEQPSVGGAPAIPFSRNPEQWIELLNRSAQPVDLSGWRFDQGIDFTFPAGTTLAPGGHLVVANAPATLNAAFPGLAALGPFAGTLSGNGERVILADALGNPADTVTYSNDGRWPEAADGGGSSLELRDPRADNALGESWAASDESASSPWKTYSYQGIAAASSVGPDAQWKEFVLGLLDKGEVLLDDISVIEAPAGAAVQMLQNTTFDTGTASWRIIGNHHGTVIDDPDQPGNKVLRLVATGSTDHMSNHAETTFAGKRSAANGREYRISYRAKWINGCRQLNTRLYFNRLAATTVLDGRPRIGTPGASNSTRTANIGPSCDGLRHDPPVPAPLAPVTVTATATDPDGVASMMLWSRPDGGTWTSQPMASDGVLPPRFSAALPGRAARTVVQFYVEATDTLGAISLLPAGGRDSRALYKVNDGLAKTNGLHNVRLVTLVEDANFLHATINLMSNERIGTTLIYDERETFYDVGLRLKGSEHSRTTSQRLGFNVGFNSAQLFRGVHRSVALDRSESTGFGQREMLVHQMVNHCGGVPTKYHDLIQVNAPRTEHTGSAELQLGRYTDVFLDGQYENGSDGMVFEYELVYQLNSTDNGNVEGNKVPAPDSVVGIGIGGLGSARNSEKEGYRWTFLIKNNEDRDDYSGVIPFCKWMNTSGAAFTSQITTRVDVSQWLRGHAVNVLSGAGDSYGGDGSQHNVQFYVRPSDGRMLYLPHDMDAFFEFNRGIVPNSDLGKIIAVPGNARMYYQHLIDIMATTYNTGYMTRWANHFGRLLPGQPFGSHLAFIGQRRTFVTNAVNAAVSPNTPFAITTNGGADLTTGSSPVTLAGTANLGVHAVRVNGILYPLNWTSRTAWSVAVPVSNGTTMLTVQGTDRQGDPIATALDSLNVTNTGPGAPRAVVINEWMADNTSPGGFPDPADGQYQDWIELHNPNDVPVDLAGSTMTDDLAQPGKWTMPAGTSIAPRGFLVVWADNETSQNTPGNGLHAAFQLSSNGESIGLYNALGVPQHTLSFGPQLPNISQGLFPDADTAAVRSLSSWTPGAANTLLVSPPFVIESITLANGTVTLTWPSTAGHTYRVEHKDALNAPTWTPLVPDVSATGPAATTTDPAGPNPQRFYRVQKLD